MSRYPSMVLSARWLGSLIALALASIPARAETRVALVIGNSAYANATPLTNPLNDARDMARALKGSGFEVVEALDADKRGLDLALRSFADKLSGADVALFFYAGHGLQVGAQNYLVPIDAKLERERDLEFEAVKLDFVLRQMEIEREGKTSIVFLDACRDNPLARNLARSMGTRSVGIGRGLAAASTGLGTFIAYATQPGNVAQDGDGRNSPFTSALVRQMSVKGRNLSATMVEVRKDVVASTGGRQVPWDHSSLTGDFYFVADGDAVRTASAQAAPAGAPAGADVTALQERLRKLEDEAKQRDRTAASSIAAGADILKLAELRARAANLDELTKDLQHKVLDARMAEGRATDKAERQKLVQNSMNIQMEMTRRGLDLQRLRSEIAALEGPPSGSAAKSPETVSASAAATAKDPSTFEITESWGLKGTEMRSMRAPSFDACREACAGEAACVGFQHGHKSPVSNVCALFSRIEARREDDQWRSGVKK